MKTNTPKTTLRTKLASVGSALSLAIFSPLALAAGESSGIIETFDEYKVEALLIIVAFAIVLWAKRGGKLLNP